MVITSLILGTVHLHVAAPSPWDFIIDDLRNRLLFRRSLHAGSHRASARHARRVGYWLAPIVLFAVASGP